MTPIATWKDKSMEKVCFQPVSLTSDCLEGNCQRKFYVFPAALCLLITTHNKWCCLGRTWWTKQCLKHTNWLWAGEDGLHDRFLFTGHQSLNSPVSPKAEVGIYLGGLIRPSLCTARFCFLLLLSSLKMSLKPQRLCLDWTRKRSQQSCWVHLMMRCRGCMCPLLPANISKCSCCPWTRVPAVPGNPCSIPITWKRIQRKLRLSALTSDLLPSLLCPEQSGCPG